MELKGKADRVRIHRLSEETSVGAERGVPGLQAPMVGRDAEIEILRSVFLRVASERRPHLVTIYGDAGVGKSRLTREFLGWTEQLPAPPVALRGRCLPYGDGITYWPLAEILKSYAGILDSDPPQLAVEKVRKIGRELLTAEVAADPVRATAALAYTVGLEDPDTPFAGADPRDVRDELHTAWRSFFTALASRRPVDHGGRRHPLGRSGAAGSPGRARGAGGRAGDVPVSGPPRSRRSPSGLGRRPPQRLIRRARPALLRAGRDAGPSPPDRGRPARAGSREDARASGGQPVLPRGDHPQPHRRRPSVPRTTTAGGRRRISATSRSPTPSRPSSRPGSTSSIRPTSGSCRRPPSSGASSGPVPSLTSRASRERMSATRSDGWRTGSSCSLVPARPSPDSPSCSSSMC